MCSIPNLTTDTSWSQRLEKAILSDEWEQALALWAEWSQLYPDDAHSYHQQSLLCNQLERGPEALSHLLKALQLAPYEPEYYDSFAALLRQHGIYKAGWCRNLGNFYLQQGRLEDALAWYQQGQKCEPQNPEWWRLLGQSTYQLGQIEQSLIYFVKLESFLPDDPSLLYNLGSLYFMVEEFRASWQYFLLAYWRKTGQTEAFALEPNPPDHPLAQFHDYLLSCAMSHFLNGRVPAFRQLCQQILRENSAHPEVKQVTTALERSLV